MQRMQLVLLSLSLVVTQAGAAHAAFDESWSAARQGDYLGALKALVAPVEDTLNGAVDQLMPKAEHGLGTVEALIGDAYYYGHGVSRDYVTAVRWYRKAAAKGNALAQSTLGDIYYYGRGAPQDFVEAAKWWQIAADNGVAIAQMNLSVMYANGDGVPQDYVKAHMYANLAAVHLPLGEDRDTAVKNREIVAKLMTPAQIAEAQRLAREWRPKQAN